MNTRSLLLTLGSGALLLAVVLMLAGGPAWGWGTVLVLAAVTMCGAVAASSDRHGRQDRA